MLAAFFVVVAPVNEALAGWTPATLPPDWSSYRLRWELGHAGRAVLAFITLGCLVRAAVVDRTARGQFTR